MQESKKQKQSEKDVLKLVDTYCGQKFRVTLSFTLTSHPDYVERFVNRIILGVQTLCRPESVLVEAEIKKV